MARELALVQRRVSLEPTQVAALAALRAHVPQVYDAANARFFDRPEEVTPERVRQVVLDAAGLEAHQRFAGETAALTQKLKRVELEAANTEARGQQRGSAEASLARTLAQQYRDPEAAAERLVAAARREGAGDGLRRLQVEPREFGDMRGTRFRRDRMATDRAVQRDLRLSGQSGHAAALTQATARVRRVSGKLSALKTQLTHLEPHEALALRMKAHTKALGSKLAMKVVIAALPPQLQVPVRLAYHGAKLARDITRGPRHEL